MQIKNCSAEDVLPLRHKILRPGRDISSAVYAEDQDKTTSHIAVVDSDKTIAVLTLLTTKKLPNYLESLSLPTNAFVQLRGMAVDEGQQGKGVGKFLIENTINQLAETGVYKILWCNARTYALPFYVKLGFKVVGDEFIVPDVGPHFVMYKTI
ncbi:MAG: GNAT family N-acetyltransferase [Bdellovibrionales bacterium]|nr:GNAT family N-acetyltransferase [Bdellovibrionales bacterium]